MPEMIESQTVSVVEYKEYLSSRYNNIGRENLSQIEAKGLYELIETRKIESNEIIQREILSIFPSWEKIAVERIMHCVGLNLNQFGLRVDLSFNEGDGLGDPLKDFLEQNLLLRHLSMFRVVVVRKEFSFDTTSGIFTARATNMSAAGRV